MNPFGLSITVVRGELPVGGVVPAAALDRYIDAAAVLHRNRSRAATLLLRCRGRREQARAEAARILAQAHAEGERRAAAAARAAHDAICAEVVRWLVDESALEVAIADRLLARCRTVVADVVGCFAGEADRGALIAQRVTAQWRALSAHGDFTLRLCPADLDAVTARLPAAPGFTISAEPTLSPGQALVDSPYVQLRIDLDRHLAGLLATLGADGADTADTADTAHGADGPGPGDGQRGAEAFAAALGGLADALDGGLARERPAGRTEDDGWPDSQAAGLPA